jgi:integral membrane protein
MLKFFRVLSLVEGLSLIVLLFIAMPAKYRFGHDFVWPVGMTHGVLWMGYVLASMLVSHVLRWSVLAWLLALVSSVVPFGFVLLDRRLKREAKAAAAGMPAA